MKLVNRLRFKPSKRTVFAVALLTIAAALTFAAVATYRFSTREDDPQDYVQLSYSQEIALGETTIEERIALSDAIVRAQFVSVEAGSINEYLDWKVGLIRYKLKVLEYLHGSGGDEVTAEVVVWNNRRWLTHESAKKEAEDVIPAFSKWHDRQMVVFLRKPDPDNVTSFGKYGADAYEFASPRGLDFRTFVDQSMFSVDSDENKAWLPAAATTTGNATKSDDAQLFLTDWHERYETASGVSAASSPPTISLAEIRKKIAAVNKQIADYYLPERGRLCTQIALGTDRIRKAWAELGVATSHFSMRSGAPAGTEFSRGHGFSQGEGGKWRTHEYLNGPLGHVFVSEDVEDDDGNRLHVRWINNRPVPAGVYTHNYKRVQQLDYYRTLPCADLSGITSIEQVKAGDTSKSSRNWTITVTAPEGTLHEAFFDPVALTDPSDGIGVRHNPKTSFTLPDKTSVTLDYLYYAPGIVKMGTTPHNALSGYEMDIIELDGKVSSTFAFGGSGSTSSPHEWATCVQPWEADDKLMLRIRKTGTGSASALAVTPCPTYTPTPTPTNGGTEADPVIQEPEGDVGAPSVEFVSATEAIETTLTPETDCPHFVPWPHGDTTGGSGGYIQVSGSTMEPYGVVSFDERIALSDVVVHAEFVSAEMGAVAFAEGYRGLIRYTFRILEYLKGEGNATVTVEVDVWTGTLWLSHQDAQSQAGAWIFANSQWHDRQMVLTLSEASTGCEGDYTFSGPGHIDQSRYAIDSDENKAWMPAADLSTRTSVVGNNEAQLFLTDWPVATGSGAESDAPTITLGEIRGRISGIDNQIATYDDPTEGHECVQIRLHSARLEPEYQKRSVRVSNFEMTSGAASGTVFKISDGASFEDWPYLIWFLVGHLDDVFVSEIVDIDADATNGYTVEWSNTRPVPSGKYTNYLKSVLPLEFVRNNPCASLEGIDTLDDLKVAQGTTSENQWTITVTAPEGTIHEAFFDPVALTDPSDDIGVRYNPKTSFTLPDKSSVTLDYLYYAPGVVKMGTTPHNALFGYEMDIIELDGKVSSTFVFDGSGSISAPHEWATCVQPWDVGDKLMLRIRKPGRRSASAITPCPN